ncbi:RIP metalloprotease RseP [uncultured Porphyromonas sp.]|uniref:RIP metalloprotease RseP n=1 Tax=uncultured Porphyromonas sp. TaxID=159274 RepID=UPI0025899B66|nr:RIP metalloprotease RseP [uncultured Porphyromonas sp.]
MGILLKVIQLLLALSILVTVHELGHFLFARLFKIRVDKFFLFFDVGGKALFRFRPKRSETEYGVGWLPLGGYCKINGMVDESLALEGLESEPKPWEFRSKPVWQRFLVMVGGVLFNVLLAMLIYGGIAYHWGVEKLPMKEVDSCLKYSSVGHQMGLQDGDLPVAVDGQELAYFEGSILQEIANGETLTVEREGKRVEVAIPVDFMRAVLASKEPFFAMDLPARIDSIVPSSAGAAAGLQRGDEIIAINGEAMNRLSLVLPKIKELRGDTISLSIIRGGAQEEIRSYVDKEQGVGIAFTPPTKLFKTEKLEYGLLESIPVGVREAGKQLTNYTDQLKYVATPEGAQSLGGFGTLGSLFPSTIDWHAFWAMTAFLSVILAVMNILPIPGLDGGHIMFLIYEAITGRAPSLKWQTRLQIFGMILLILLVLYANINDVIRFLL